MGPKLFIVLAWLNHAIKNRKQQGISLLFSIGTEDWGDGKVEKNMDHTVNYAVTLW